MWVISTAKISMGLMRDFVRFYYTLPHFIPGTSASRKHTTYMKAQIFLCFHEPESGPRSAIKNKIETELEKYALLVPNGFKLIFHERTKVFLQSEVDLFDGKNYVWLTNTWYADSVKTCIARFTWSIATKI